MINTYFAVLVLILIAAGFVGTMLLLAIVLGPKHHTEMKDDPFECGTVGSGNVSQRHSVKFYLVAMTFIVFDLEIVFLYPWAIQLRELGWPGFWVMLPFLVVLTVGLLYEYRRKVLDVI
ncbi:MAG: NADH-quinone oxidoreductase subunit A [Bdellovibrionales bacterium]|nr:NADH-quinone oxidoreductase subunit A [Bdellovibrionales bacterium]